MASKTKETPEQMLERWLADPKRVTVGYSDLVEAGWEAGQVGYHEIYGSRYEKFHFDNGTFCVVEWDEHGNVSVA